ncbi:glyceraldehyde-3-phosphate dehydrogenase, type I, partial [Gonapodya prolifera JEL478]
GRMGRLALRAIFERNLQHDIQIVAINEIKGGATATAHLLKYDSIKVPQDGSSVIVDDTYTIRFTEMPSIDKLEWTELGLDVVLECTGKFTKVTDLKPYFNLGIKKVVVSAPVKEEGVLNVGVNHDQYDPSTHSIITAASCTTNCLAPIVKVIHENLKIKHGCITTIHCVTNTQVIVDAPHKDLRRARSCITYLVPTTTGSATAIAVIFPELKGKLNGIAVRTPLLNASITDAVFEVSRPTTKDEVNALFKAAADCDTPLGKVLGYCEEELVGEDFRNDTRSCIVDSSMTTVVDGTQVKVLGWYDNELGYVWRMVDVLLMVCNSLAQHKKE